MRTNWRGALGRGPTDSRGMIPWIGPWGLSGPRGMTHWTQGTDWPTSWTPGSAAVPAASILGAPPSRRHLSAESAKHTSPGQATPKAERRPGWSAIFARVPRPLWPQSAKLTGAKEAMELIPAFSVAPCHRSFRPPLQGSVSGGAPTQGDAPCGRLPWAILGRAFGAKNLGK